jgi:hypothetical protein
MELSESDSLTDRQRVTLVSKLEARDLDKPEPLAKGSSRDAFDTPVKRSQRVYKPH